jgi:mono/diheme cytochrome c family protein
MFKYVLIASVLAACGGKSKPTATTTTEPAPPAATTAESKPAEEPQNDVLAASALAEQYEIGKEIYAKECASCHGDHGEGNPKNPALIGDGALPEKATFSKAKLRKTVAFKTAGDVFEFIRTKMPIDKPGKLTEDQYLAVLAWDLNENKVALDHKLTKDNVAGIKLR